MFVANECGNTFRFEPPARQMRLNGVLIRRYFYEQRIFTKRKCVGALS